MIELKKRTPQTLTECNAVNPQAEALASWADRLASWGKILAIILLVIGFFGAIGEAAMIWDYEESVLAALFAFVGGMLSWAIYAFISYAAAKAIAMILEALASITQNTSVSASVALYTAAKDLPAQEAPKAAVPQAAPAQPAPRTNAETRVAENGVWFCGQCGRQNAPERVDCWCCGAKK